MKAEIGKYLQTLPKKDENKNFPQFYNVSRKTLEREREYITATTCVYILTL